MPHIRQVYESLQEVATALDELREALLQERRDIVGLDLNGLAERREDIEKRFAQIGILNSKVAAQICSACDAAGLAGESTLSPLIAVVPKPDRDMYVRLQKTVRAVSAEVENELAINRELLKDSVAFTNQSLQMFTGIMKSSSNSTYGQQGRFVETLDQPQIICKEI